MIVNLNGEEFISSCVASVLEQEVETEIIVVDNGSTDNSIGLLSERFPRVRILQNEENLGFAGPANQGAEVAKGEFILFLNNDARLTPTTLETLVHNLQSNDQIAACQPTIMQSTGKLDSAGSMFTKTGFLYHVTLEDVSSKRFDSNRFSLHGACFLVRTKIFFRAGGFDESYFAYFEESDLCWRFLSLGYQVEHVKDSLVVHDAGRTSSSIFPSSEIDFLSFRNRISTIRKNGNFKLKARVLPIHFACCLFVAASFAVKGKPRNAAGILRALLWRTKPRTYPTKPVSLKFLTKVTVPFRITAALHLLKSYLVRW